MSHPAGLEPQAKRGMAILPVAIALSSGYVCRSFRAACYPRWLCVCGGVAEVAERACAPPGIRRNRSFLRTADFLRGRGGNRCVDQGFRRTANGAGGHRRHGGMAAAVAHDQSREGRIRRLPRNEDRDGDWRRNCGWHSDVDPGIDHCDTHRRTEHHCRHYGEDRGTDLERLYHYAGGGGGKRSAGVLSISDRADFCAGHRVLSRVFDLFFGGALSCVERHALSARTPTDDPALQSLGATAAVAACPRACWIKRKVSRQGTLTPPRVSDVADTRVPSRERSFLCRSQWQAGVRAGRRLTSRR